MPGYTLCPDDGCMIVDGPAHDLFHERLAQPIAQLAQIGAAVAGLTAQVAALAAQVAALSTPPEETP